MPRYFLLVSVSLVLILGSLAQSQDCATSEIAVGVIKANGDPIQGLAAGDFTAQFKKQPLSIQSASYDSGARRILLVIDGDHKLSAEARKAEMAFGSAVISSAQPADSLALISARGVEREVKFGSDRAALLDALKESSSEQKESTKERGVLDAVAEGIAWFGEPRLGDSIIVVAMDLEGNHKTNYKSMAKLVEERRIRVFGVALGHLQLQNSTTGTQQLDREGFGYRDPGMPFYNSDADPNFFPFTVNSGGYIVQEDTRRSSVEFKVTEAKKQELEKTGAMMSTLIDKVYALRIQNAGLAHSEPWILSVSQAKLPGPSAAHVLYPHELSACPQSTAGK